MRRSSTHGPSHPAFVSQLTGEWSHRGWRTGAGRPLSWKDEMKLTEDVLFLSGDASVEVHAEAPVQLWASRSHTDVVLRVIRRVSRMRQLP